MGVTIYAFALPNTKIFFSSLGVSETFVSGVSSMYNVIMDYLNSFLLTSNALSDIVSRIF